MAGAFLITMTTMTIETYKDSRSRSYVPFLPFSLFVLVQQDDGVVVVPPPGGAGVCGGSDREWMYESVGYNVCLLVLSAAEHSPPGQKLRLGGVALGADPTYLLYLPSRSRGGLRRIDFGAWPRAATSNHICLMQVGGSRLSPHLSRAAGHLSGRVGAH